MGVEYCCSLESKSFGNQWNPAAKSFYPRIPEWQSQDGFLPSTKLKNVCFMETSKASSRKELFCQAEGESLRRFWREHGLSFAYWQRPKVLWYKTKGILRHPSHECKEEIDFHRRWGTQRWFSGYRLVGQYFLGDVGVIGVFFRKRKL